MDVLLWLLGLFLLWWAIVIVAAQAARLADRYRVPALLNGLMAVALLVGLVVWAINESARTLIAQLAVGSVALSLLMAVAARVMGGRPHRGITQVTPAAPAGSFFSGTVPDPVSGPQGKAFFAHACAICGGELMRPDEVITQQLLLVQSGLGGEARAVENKQGYRCQSCGKEYCKSCLEAGAPYKPSGDGRLCPSCRGTFAYIGS